MCSTPNVYMFVYTLIGTQIVPLITDFMRFILVYHDCLSNDWLLWVFIFVIMQHGADVYAANDDLVSALIAQWTKVADKYGKAITVLH